MVGTRSGVVGVFRTGRRGRKVAVRRGDLPIDGRERAIWRGGSTASVVERHVPRVTSALLRWTGSAQRRQATDDLGNDGFVSPVRGERGRPHETSSGRPSGRVARGCRHVRSLPLARLEEREAPIIRHVPPERVERVDKDRQKPAGGSLWASVMHSSMTAK